MHQHEKLVKKRNWAKLLQCEHVCNMHINAITVLDSRSKPWFFIGGGFAQSVQSLHSLLRPCPPMVLDRIRWGVTGPAKWCRVYGRPTATHDDPELSATWPAARTVPSAAARAPGAPGPTSSAADPCPLLRPEVCDNGLPNQRRGCPHLRSRNPSSVGEAKFHSGLGGPSPTLPPGYEPGPGSRRVVARQEGGPFGQRNFGLER